MKKVLTLLLVFVFALSVPILAMTTDNKAEKFKIEKSIVKTDLVAVELKVAVATVNSSHKEPEKVFLYQHRFKQEANSFNSEVRFIHPNQFCKYSYYTKLPDKIYKE